MSIAVWKLDLLLLQPSFEWQPFEHRFIISLAIEKRCESVNHLRMKRTICCIRILSCSGRISIAGFLWLTAVLNCPAVKRAIVACGRCPVNAAKGRSRRMLVVLVGRPITIPRSSLSGSNARRSRAASMGGSTTENKRGHWSYLFFPTFPWKDRTECWKKNWSHIIGIGV